MLLVTRELRPRIRVAGLETQQDQLAATGCAKVFSEQASSVGQRGQLAAVLDYARDGDTLVVARLDRLAKIDGGPAGHRGNPGC